MELISGTRIYILVFLIKLKSDAGYSNHLYCTYEINIHIEHIGIKILRSASSTNFSKLATAKLTNSENAERQRIQILRFPTRGTVTPEPRCTQDRSPLNLPATQR